MKKVVILLIALFVFDVYVDSADADCVASEQAAGCHSCLCQNHGTGPIRIVSDDFFRPVAAPYAYVSEVSDHGSLLSKGVFHPPRIFS